MIRLPPTRVLTTLRRYGLSRRPGLADRWQVGEKPAAQIMPMAPAYPWRRLAIGLLVLVVVALFASSQGSVWISPLTVAEILTTRLPLVEIAQSWPDTWETIVWQLRLPRIGLAALVGASLAISGATYQGMFRNPLADPSLIGASSGAGLGATIVLLTGVPLYFHGVSLLPAAAFAGAVLAVAVAYVVARQSEGLPLTTLILAGVAIASLATAVTSLLMIRSDPDLRPVFSWLLGGFISAQWKHSLMMLPYLIPSLGFVMAFGRILNVLQLGDDKALQLGVNVERTKVLLITAATLLTAAAVSFSGIIGFVGLIAPHTVRLIWGADHRFMLPMAAIVGAGFLVLADVAARTVASPAELPVGVVTAFCGAPFFIYLLRRRKRVVM